MSNPLSSLPVIVAEGLPVRPSTTYPLTAGGGELQELIVAMTGCDPLAEPAFQWSESLPCDECAVVDATAEVSLDGETFQRLCHECLR